MLLTSTRATRRIGDHRKNSVAVQKDINLFTKSVSMLLNPFALANNGITAPFAYVSP